MKTRVSLSAKIFLLAFLNFILLGVVFLIFARIQFRFDLSSFLLAPARDRILSISRLIGLQLPNVPPDNWNELLSQYSATYPAEFYLFDSDGKQLAGRPVALPQEIVIATDRDRFEGPRREGGPPPPRPAGPPPLVFTRTTRPSQYWVAVHMPVWTAGRAEPIHGALIWRFSRLWTSPYFFDYRPWIAAVFAIVTVSMVCWLPLIRGLTRAISELTAATGQIAEGHFEIELPSNRRDELGRLSDSINRMAKRLYGFVHGQKRFLGDIAHELCAPIARIQVALGILEQRSGASQSAYVADLQEEVEHMSGLVNELLSFSKAQINAGTDLTKVNVAQVLRRVLQREAPSNASVETRVSEELEVIAQPEYLFRSLANVIRNAIRYAGNAGPIIISAENGGGTARIRITDSGPGLPESELEEVFRPFYRPEFARQRETGGTGLGLAIVKSCIEACGGAVGCRNKSPNGLEVEIRLRIAQE